MSAFKTSEWDSDSTGDNYYRELFKDSKKHKEKSKFSNGKIVKDRKDNIKLKKALERAGRAAIHTRTDIEKLTASDKDRLNNKQKVLEKYNSRNSDRENNIISTKHKNSVNEIKERKRKEKHKKDKISGESLENGVTKKQKKIRKHTSDILKDDSNHSNNVKEKKRKKKLKKKLEKTTQKDVLLNKIIETSLKNKIIELERKKEKLAKERRKKEEKEKERIAAIIQEHLKQKRMQAEKLPDQKNMQIDKMPDSLILEKKKKLQEKLKTILSQQEQNKIKPVLTLRQKMMEKLKAARFRFLNEQIYTTNGKEAQRIFKSDPEAFRAYHEGYRQQVKRWPLNPLDIIIKNIRKLPKTHIIADFGCGDARLAKSVEQKVHSFDLIAVNDSVVACDMAKVPLDDDSVDVAVFCLSLMGTNLHDYLLEANRVLKLGGILKIAEVESRFENVDSFIDAVRSFGFKKTWKDLSHNLFYFMDFRKENNIKNKKKLPTISLLPCLYKKR